MTTQEGIIWDDADRCGRSVSINNNNCNTSITQCLSLTILAQGHLAQSETGQAKVVTEAPINYSGKQFQRNMFRAFTKGGCSFRRFNCSLGVVFFTSLHVQH